LTHNIEERRAFMKHKRQPEYFYMDDEQEKEERKDRFSKIWWKSRADAGVSQEYLANELGISRKTVQNWERGVSAPTLFQGTEWFRALGINPLPYYLAYIFPESMDGIKAEDEDEKIEEALMDLIPQLSKMDKRRLLFILYGNHGSSPTAVLNLVNAHLQTPLNDRIMQANSILSNYELEKEMGNIVHKNHVQPDTELLRNAITEAKSTAVKKQKGYSATFLL